jgi:aminoglycoside 6-adenylyltransferase
MHPDYTQTLQQITTWAAAEPGIHGLVLIGSQARSAPPADAWSDADLMLLVDDPRRWMDDPAWLAQFGAVVCWFDEVVPLHGYRWSWYVKRALYSDLRYIDISILPHDSLDEVLEVNRHILVHGYQVLYADDPTVLEARIRALPAAETQTGAPPGEAALGLVVSNLLFHVIWAMKKIRRGELWMATSCINGYMQELLLQLIEAHNFYVRQQPNALGYDGRFLEQRSAPAVLDHLKECSTRYDAAEAAASLGSFIGLAEMIWREVCARNGWHLDPAPFAQVREMHAGLASSRF